MVEDYDPYVDVSTPMAIRKSADHSNPFARTGRMVRTKRGTGSSASSHNSSVQDDEVVEWSERGAAGRDKGRKCVEIFSSYDDTFSGSGPAFVAQDAGGTCDGRSDRFFGLVGCNSEEDAPSLELRMFGIQSSGGGGARAPMQHGAECETSCDGQGHTFGSVVDAQSAGTVQEEDSGDFGHMGLIPLGDDAGDGAGAMLCRPFHARMPPKAALCSLCVQLAVLAVGQLSMSERRKPAAACAFGISAARGDADPADGDEETDLGTERASLTSRIFGASAPSSAAATAGDSDLDTERASLTSRIFGQSTTSSATDAAGASDLDTERASLTSRIFGKSAASTAAATAGDSDLDTERASLTSRIFGKSDSYSASKNGDYGPDEGAERCRMETQPFGKTATATKQASAEDGGFDDIMPVPVGTDGSTGEDAELAVGALVLQLECAIYSPTHSDCRDEALGAAPVRRWQR